MQGSNLREDADFGIVASDHTLEPSASDVGDITDDFEDITEFRPLLHPKARLQEENVVSATRTFMNMLKGMIGPGCLALPLAFKYAGLWVGLFLILVIGALNVHGMFMLARCAQFLCNRCGRRELDYGHLSKKAFDYGPEWARLHSKKALYFTNVLIAVYQLGVCSVQFVFLGANIQKLMVVYRDDLILSMQSLISIVLLPQILLNFIRHLKFLAFLSLMGNLFMLVGFLIVFQLIVRPPNVYYQCETWFYSFDRLMLAMGAMLYAFEGQAMILPMENKMKRPADLVRTCGVLDASMWITVAIYTATGFFGYLHFGNDVKGSITLNLPEEKLYYAVLVLLVAAVFVGCPLQFYIVIEMLWPAIRRKLPERFASRRLALEYIFRALCILLSYTLAMIVPNLDQIIPLVGITAGMIIGFMIPAVLETVTFWQFWKQECSSRTFYWKCFKNSLLFLFGLFGLIAGLYTNLKTIITDSTL